MSVSLIVAYESYSGVIGVNGKLPWSLPRDLAFFKHVTQNSVVVMGRKTYESLPKSCRPLPNRINAVITSTESSSLDDGKEVVVIRKEHVREYVQSWISTGHSVFVIGGEQTYRLFFEEMSDLVQEVIATYVNASLDVKAAESVSYFDRKWLDSFSLADVSGTYLQETPPITYNYVYFYQRKALGHLKRKEWFREAVAAIHSVYKENEELQYINLIKNIYEKGDSRMTRGVDSEGNRLSTKSLFGYQLRFDLSDGLLPICTLRKCWATGCIYELLWILRGSTDVKELADLGVHVWDANTTRQALDSYGFPHRPEYDLGPTYGFNLRHFGQGVNYTTKLHDYSGYGKDQLQELVAGLLRDPYSRRHLLTLWDPASVNQASLPPCSVLFQFSVNSRHQLSLHVFLRSSDTLLALYSWNVPQYAVLCALVAKRCGLALGELVVSISDAHIYNNYLAGLDMINRVPLPLPLLTVVHSKEPHLYTAYDISVTNYRYHPHIIIPMAV